MSVRGEKGQTLVEFALVLPILVLLVIGMLEFGRVLNVWLIVNNAAREGARYATVGVSEAEVIARVKEACPTLDADSLVVEVSGAQGLMGSPVAVRVESAIELVPLIGALFPENPFPVGAQAVMALE